MKTLPSRKEYLSIQYLRGIAAILVVIYHLEAPLRRLEYEGGWPVGLSGGVDIFFVISGFVMWMTTRTRSITPLRFWMKRIVRIVPLYWLVTTFMLVILLAAPSVMNTSVFDLKHVAGSYIFLPMLHPSKPSMEPLLFAGWTLNYEMFFYLLFGLFLLTRPVVRLWGTVGVLVALVLMGVTLGAPRLSLFGFYSYDIVLEFGFGMLLGELVFKRGSAGLLPAVFGLVLTTAGLLLLLSVPLHSPIPRSISFGLPALLVVVGMISVELADRLPHLTTLHVLGNASYSIYLTQLITMAAFSAAWRKTHPDRATGSLLAFGVLDLLAAVVVGCLCYLIVERRLVRAFGGDTRRRMPDVERKLQPEQ